MSESQASQYSFISFIIVVNTIGQNSTQTKQK